MEARDMSTALADFQANHEGFGSFLSPWAFFFFFLSREGRKHGLIEKIGLDDGAQPMVAFILGHWDLLLAQQWTK